MILGIVAVLLVISTVIMRWESTANDPSALSRLIEQKRAIGIILDHLVCGVGLGNYMIGIIGLGARIPVHNKFLLLTAETGLIGMLLYVLFWLFIFKLGLKRLRELTGMERSVALGILSAMVGTFINMQVDMYYLAGPGELALFILGGILAAISKKSYAL